MSPTPALFEAATKGLTVVRSAANNVASQFPAFSGTTGQIDHAGGRLTASGLTISPQNALRVAACWIAVTLLSDEVASLTRRIVRRDDRTRRPLQPPQLRAMWGDPNPDQTDFDIVSSEIMSLTLHGGLFEMLAWTDAGDLGQRWVLPPESCRLSRRDDGGLDLHVTGMGTLENPYGDPRARPEFMMIPLYSLPGRLGFVSPVAYAAELLGLSAQYGQTAARLAGEGFNPAAVLTADEFVDDAEAESIARRLERHSGNRTGRIAVVGGKDLKLEKWTMSLADAQFIEQYDEVFHLLLAIWRVPPTAAGMVDKPSTWGSGIAEFSRGLERFTLRPLTRRLDGGYERYMTRVVDPRLQHKHVFDSMLSADPKDRAEIQRTRVQWGLTSVERVLAQEDEPPFDDDETVYSQLAVGNADLNRLRAQAEVYGSLIRAGVAPAAAATVAGFDPDVLTHLGLAPTTVQAEGGQ